MHAKSSDNRTTGDCSACRGSGRSPEGAAADEFLKLPEPDRDARFLDMSYDERVALFENDAAEYRRLAGGAE